MSDDYDYDAARRAGVKPDARGHWPDTYKLPNHMTFSDESIYSRGADKGGHWQQAPVDQHWLFTPGPTNLQHHSPDELRDYFSRVEPQSSLILPSQGRPMTEIPMRNRRLPFGLLPPADLSNRVPRGMEGNPPLPQPDPRTRYIARGMDDLIEGGGDAVRPGQPGYERGGPNDRDQAQRYSSLQPSLQALSQMIQRDPSILWGTGDAMNPADREWRGGSLDRMPNFAYPTSDGGNLPDTGIRLDQIPGSTLPGPPRPDSIEPFAPPRPRETGLPWNASDL